MKKILCALLLCVCALSLSACVKTEKEPEKQGTYIAPKDDLVRQTVGFYATAEVTGSAVQTQTLRYTVAGTPDTAGGEMTLTFDAPVGRGFNRLCFCYESTENVAVTVAYTANGATVEDTFYLEAGTDSVYGYIASFADGKTADGVSSLSVSAVNGRAFSFVLYDIKTECADALPDTVYTENDSYKLGLRMRMGGAIGYLEDKRASVDGIKNLINCHDTGRLVQQSYYGTGGNGEYTPGYYNGGSWSYNPVQGGDKYGNISRIVDFAQKDGQVYIKTQALDWSNDGYYTPSYMENVYTLYDDRVRVDNRFVDFSGWSNPSVTQELPAFYTLTYFDTFTMYNGSHPWTNDALTVRAGLGFWGETSDQNYPYCYANTETWCAWTHGTDGYGVGLYVPGADAVVAGVFGSTGIKDAKASPTSYAAPLCTLRLSAEPIEYSYLITTGTVTDIRKTFTEYKDFAENAVLQKDNTSMRVPSYTTSLEKIDLSQEYMKSFLSAQYHSSLAYDSILGAVLMTVDGFDPQVRIRYNYSAEPLYAEDYDAVEIIYKTEAAQTGFELFYCTGDRTEAQAGYSVTGEYINDGSWHTVRVPLSGDGWTGKINAIRFDFFNDASVGDSVYIMEINLVKKEK